MVNITITIFSIMFVFVASALNVLGIACSLHTLALQVWLESLDKGRCTTVTRVLGYLYIVVYSIGLFYVLQGALVTATRSPTFLRSFNNVSGRSYALSGRDVPEAPLQAQRRVYWGSSGSF